MLLRSRRLAAVAFAVMLLAQLSGVAEVALVRLIPPLKQLAREGKFGPPEAKAAGQYNATGGVLRTGAEMAITTVGTSGNTGSWRGTLAADGWGWGVSTPASAGLNQILYFDGVDLQNANKMEVKIYASSGSASLLRSYQICDWVNNSKVDSDPDADCSNGGWRTLQRADAGSKGRRGIAEAALRYYTWHIYDGYWNMQNGTSIGFSYEPQPTPLSNFVSSTGRVMLRAYSASSIYSTHLFNWATISLVVDPVYFPAASEVITGNQTGETSYIFAQSPPTLLSGTGGTTGSDNGYLKVSGTAGSIADYFVKFKNVRTYTGANSIAVAMESGCSAVGINYRPKVFNFYSGAWEDLTPSSIACAASGTDTARQFGFSTTSLWKYIRDGEVRVGMYGLSNGTQEIRLDYIYIVIGSTVVDTSRCEISFGTGVATQCGDATDMDSTLSSTTGWKVTTEADSNTFGHDYYASDNDADAVASEMNAAVHMRLPVRVPSAATLAGMAFSVRFLSSSTSITLQPQLRDFGGLNPTAVGGFTNFGTAAASTSTYLYTDPIQSVFGYLVTSSEDYIDSYDDTVWVRFRTSVSTMTTAVSPVFEYVMVSIRWVESDVPRRTLQYEYTPTNGRLLAGSEMNRYAAATVGNIGSWRATMGAEANDGFGWAVTTTGTGLNQQLDFSHVQTRGANKMVVTVYASNSVASLPFYYQICDWATTTAVDATADSYCSGGWRTLNKPLGGLRLQFTDTARRTWTWPIYEGFWNVPLVANGTGTSDRIVSSTISNFVSSTDGIVRIRAYSTSTGGSRHMINYASLQVVVDPVYHPAGRFVVTGNGTGLSNYLNAVPPPTLISGGAGATGSDNNYMAVSGTASVTTEFWSPFRNVKTYPGMNAILAVMETGCSAVGISYTPRIYNFSTPGWEPLAGSAIACGAGGTDTTGQYAKTGITIGDYVKNGEVRIGWLGSGNGTQEIRVDWVYIVLGTVKADTSGCRIDYGTNSSGDCTNTGNIDTASAVSQWSVSTAQESAAMAGDYYALAGDSDATAEQLDSIYVPFTLTAPTGTTPAGMVYALRWRSGGAGMTQQPQFLDQGRNGATSGGFINFGTTNASTSTYSYIDVISNGYFTTTPEDFINSYTSTTAVRIRATTITTVGLTLVSDYDFIMVSYRWVEDPNSTDITLTVDPATIELGSFSAGAPASTHVTLTLASTNATGHTLYAQRNDANTTLDLIADSATNITDKAEWYAPGVTTTAGNAAAYTGTGLAFRLDHDSSDAPIYSDLWWGTDDTTNSLWAGLPTTSQAIGVRSTAGTSNASADFKLDVPVNQPSGDYDGVLTFTASANP